MADMLRRSQAPITDEAWAEIDEVAKRALTPLLSARGVVDFTGPLGWDIGAINLGRLTASKKGQAKDLTWGVRDVLPLVEVRVPFSLKLAELQDLSRGAKDADLAPLEAAARKIAAFEEEAVYKGVPAAGLEGVLSAATSKPVALVSDLERYAQAVGQARQVLRAAGVGGPYALVLGGTAHEALNQITRSGHTLGDVLARVVQGPIVWSPVLDGGVLLSTRGGDFELTVGQDLSIGYDGHAADAVNLYFSETLAFRVLEPAAAVALTMRAAK